MYVVVSHKISSNRIISRIVFAYARIKQLLATSAGYPLLPRNDKHEACIKKCTTLHKMHDVGGLGLAWCYFHDRDSHTSTSLRMRN